MNNDAAQLVAAARDGNEGAWDALVDSFAGLVWHVIRGFRLPEAAGEDVYQTTWLRLAEHLDRIRKPEAVGGWLATTARNECLRAVKLSGRERLTDDIDLDYADTQSSADATIEQSSEAEILWRAFANLSEACQRLLRLLIAEPPMSYEQVGELLDLRVGSIGPTRARCLAKMRTAGGMHLLGQQR